NARILRAAFGILPKAAIECLRQRCRELPAASPCSQKIGERPGKNEVAAPFTTTGPEIDNVVGCPDDLLLVLDDEQRVSFVAQIVHDLDEPADIPGVQPDAWLVHDKQRADQ